MDERFGKGPVGRGDLGVESAEPAPRRPALHVLFMADRHVTGTLAEHREQEDTIRRAAHEVARYHAPVGDQAERHARLSGALADFLVAIVSLCPPSADRERAIECARSAKMWASAAIALEGR